MNIFGDFLKKLRGEKSLREMEKITGLSHTYLSSLEKGKDPRNGNERKPSPEVLKKIANSLSDDEGERIERYFKMMALCGYVTHTSNLSNISTDELLAELKRRTL